MAVPIREQRILLQKSGNRCAFPGCRRLLTAEDSPPDRAVILGEIAHIVGESFDGPRGDSPLTLPERNRYENLVLLCNVHHQLIDDQTQTYTIERLQQIKQDHEDWVARTLGRGYDHNLPFEAPLSRSEVIYSTLLPVIRMPRFIFGGPCEFNDEHALMTKIRLSLQREMTPFIIKNGMLFAFQNLSNRENPFCDIVKPNSCKRYFAREWWDDPDKAKWFVTLTNRALNKLTGRHGLSLDKQHSRYYFRPEEAGQELEIEYRPLNQKRSSRKVVWQPKSRRTGEGHGYWYHRAVSLQFIRIGIEEWCLSIRPELHVTTDGLKVLTSEKIGSRITHKKSRMFNYDLLGEVQFWRDFLSDSQPRIIMPFDKNQNIIISSTLMSGNVTWPGIPEEYAKSFKNVEYIDDLFSWAEFSVLDTEQEREDLEELEEDNNDEG